MTWVTIVVIYWLSIGSYTIVYATDDLDAIQEISTEEECMIRSPGYASVVSHKMRLLLGSQEHSLSYGCVLLEHLKNLMRDEKTRGGV